MQGIGARQHSTLYPLKGRTVGVTLVTMADSLTRERSTTLLFYGCILLLGYLVYLLLQPFLTPLAWAAIFAAFFYPRYKRL